MELERRVERAGSYGEQIWPPSYAEFTGMCLNPTGANWEHKRIEGADREYAMRSKLLADARAQDHSDDVAYVEMAKIREMLGMKPCG